MPTILVGIFFIFKTGVAEVLTETCVYFTAHLQIYVFDLKTCINYKEEQVASTMLEVLCLHVYYSQVAPMELKT